MDKLKVVLDWFPNTNHAGYIVAKKRGWYEEAGLDVEITGKVHGNMELHGADFICGPETAMLACKENGIGMTAVAVFTQKCDSGIVSLKEEGIDRPKNLEGKILTHWDQEWFHVLLSRILEKDGGDYSKVKKLQMDVGDIVDVLEHTANATWVYENWENEVLREAGHEINYFNLGDIDPIFDFCAPAMAAASETLKNKPDAVRRFLKATDMGFREAAAHPDEVALEIKDWMPEGCSDEMLIRSMRHLAPLWLDSKGRWGRIAPERWNRMAEFTYEMKDISRRWDDEFTNEYFED